MTDAPRRHGFTRAASLVEKRIRAASESRGFAVARVLTRWDEVAGPDLAALCTPVGITWGKGAMGATLTVLTTGPKAPMLEMVKDRLRDRVNAAYGHRAVHHVRITQTAATGFAEPKAGFVHAPGPAPRAAERAEQAAAGITDTELRLALAALGANVLSKSGKTGKDR
jgi:hypothetical protein